MISVLLPSRNRHERLKATIENLRDKANEPTEVEILVATDDDDQESTLIAQKMDCAVFEGPRYGYHRLHEYYNRLALTAAGEWCLLWNDDVVMCTEGWDSVIEVQQHPAVLNLPSNHEPNLCCFPCVSTSLIKAWGHFSLSPHCDSWVHEVGMAAGIHRVQPGIYVEHERFDMTGKNNDQTYQESQAGYRSEEFGSPAMSAGRDKDAAIARKMIRG